MRDFPFDGCLTTDELLAYGSMLTSERDVELRVSEHLRACTACLAALSRLGDAPTSIPSPPVRRSATLAIGDALGTVEAGRFGMGKSLANDRDRNQAEETLDRQRRQLAGMLEMPQPPIAAGQVWAVDWSWDGLDFDSVLDGSARGDGNTGSDLAPLVLVLRSFLRHATGLPVVDLLPLTDDARLAAEWSIAFSASVSGLEVPLVAHVDYQFTASPHRLGRCLGTLGEDAWTDVLTVSRAWGQGEFPPSELRVGRLGQPGIRDWPAWTTWDEACQKLLVAMRPADSEVAVLERDALSGISAAARRRSAAGKARRCENVRITMCHPTTLAPLLTIHVQRERYRDLQDWCSQNEPNALSIVERVGQAPLALFEPPTNWQYRLTTHVGRHLPPNLLKLVSACFRDYRLAKSEGAGASLIRKAAREQDA